MYRIKQFIWAITAKLTRKENAFFKTYLDQEEQQLFAELKVYEQKHCIKVAMHLEQLNLDEASETMIKLGLLHDIGKIKYPIDPIRKSIMVVLDKITKGKIKKWDRMKMVRCYYQHPEIGYKILEARGVYDTAFLEVIRNHHKVCDVKKSILLQQLQKIDNLY